MTTVDDRIFRGGSYKYPAYNAKSAGRYSKPPSSGAFAGVRPAADIEP